jgi:hypothetical protein
MKTHNRSTKLLATAIAFGLLAAIYSLWGAQPAQAIIVVDTKTGMTTLTQGLGIRAFVVNIGDEGFAARWRVLDSAGITHEESERQMVPPGQAASFEFTPRLAEGEARPLRVELMVEGAGRRSINFIPTLEVFNTATQVVCWLVDFTT